MDDYVTTGTIRGGRLKVTFGPSQQRALTALKDGAYTVSLRRVSATRTARANAFYWGVIVRRLSEHTGFTPDEMHEVLKAKFLPKELAVCDANGVIVDGFVIGGSTRKLGTVAFGEYCDAIRRWAAEDLHVDIPDPEAR